jgi:LysR family cyn operon transcriptional activator
MDISYLRVFFEVAKAGRFSEAAKKLGISQSALSRSVGLLEESEGVQLFERSKKGVELTAIGTEVFQRCERLFQTFHEIEGIVRGTRETCDGLLRFATSDHITNDFLLSPLQAFRGRYPGVVPSIVTGPPDAIVHALLNSDCEFGLLFSKVSIPQIENRSLRMEKMALVCSPEVWKRNKAGNNSKTLKKVVEDVGYLASLGAIIQNRPSRVLQELFGDMPKIGLETNSQETQKRFCLAGGGVAYLIRFMVEKEINEGKLFEIPVDNPHEFYLWLATKKGHHLSLTARTFIELLEKQGSLVSQRK